MRENRCSFKQFSLGVPAAPLGKWEAVGISQDKKECMSYLKHSCYHTEILHSPKLSQQEPFWLDHTSPCMLQEDQILDKDLTELSWRREFTYRRLGLSWLLTLQHVDLGFFFCLFLFLICCCLLPQVSSVRVALTPIWTQLVAELPSVALLFRGQLLRAFCRLGLFRWHNSATWKRAPGQAVSQMGFGSVTCSAANYIFRPPCKCFF